MKLILMFSLLSWHIGQTEAAVEKMRYNMTDFDVNDIIKIRCCPADDCFPSQPEVASLNNKLKGRVIVPHMQEYANQSHMYNTVEQRYPRLVVMVHSKEDIRETVLFARKFNLHVTMRSSGHDYVGRSTWDGSININLSEMKEYEVKLDSSRSEHGEIKLQTGLTWAEIYKMLDQQYNRTIVGGSAHTVTPGGYTIGGGHSPISRTTFCELGFSIKFAPWDGSEENIFKEFIAIAKELQTNVTFTNLSSFWDYEKDVYDPPIARAYIVNTMLQPDKVNEELITFFKEQLFTNMKGIYFGCTGASVGGRTTEFSVDSTPLHPGYRTAVTSLTCGVALADPATQSWFDQSKYDDFLIPKADEFSKGLQRFGYGMYLNEPTKNNPNWREDFWGDHYERLLKIKKRYDPENFFTCHHCVGSEMEGKSTTPWSSSASASRFNFLLAAFLFFIKYMM